VRIALLSPPWYPVPPTAYGGVEAIVALLADGLVEAGHDVTLFASGDSRTSARLESVYDTAPSARIGQFLPELRHVLACYECAAEFDVVNDHSGPPAVALSALADVPLVHTVHWPLDGEGGDAYEQIARMVPRARFISLSTNQRRPRPGLPWIANCPNALDLSRYPPMLDRAGDYLLFLGRMTPEKGCHRAIEVAQQARLPLKIAAKNREPWEQAYFSEFVEPHLSPRIEFVGEVDHEAKVELLRGARATLFPIDWEEPFGLVPVESMACGTPVIATRRGAVPEVVPHGLGGIVVDDPAEMVDAIAAVDRLDRTQCRRYAERRFSAARLVEDYENAFARALAGGDRGRTRLSPAGSGAKLGRA
jgi:glycosyltransferase involved in cell wall biosynthesis